MQSASSRIWNRVAVSISNDDNHHGHLEHLFLIIISTKVELVVFQWSLSDNKSPQLSRTFLSIIADISNAVVYLVWILPPISTSPSLFSLALGKVPRGTN